MKMQFRTRVRGTSKQIGKRFPLIRTPLKRPTLDRAELKRGRMPLTPLEEHALLAEEELLAANFKGWTITVKYKDGSKEDIPIIAKDYEQALKKAKPKMSQRKDMIDEIVIVDPLIGEVLHAIGAGARKAAGLIGRGAKGAIRLLGKGARAIAKLPGKVERGVLRAARAVGRAEALPEEAKEMRAAARAERPWEEEEAPEEAAPAEQRAIRRAPEAAPPTRRPRGMTIAEWRAEEAPEIYRREEAPPSAEPMPCPPGEKPSPMEREIRRLRHQIHLEKLREELESHREEKAEVKRRKPTKSKPWSSTNPFY